MKTLVYYNMIADTIQLFTFKEDRVRIEYQCIVSGVLVDHTINNSNNYHIWLIKSGYMEFLGEL